MDTNDLRSKLRKGKLCLIGMGCLALVTKMTKDGFDFDCENGAWSGHYCFADDSVTIDNTDEPRRVSAGGILCTDQPPPEIRRGGYNVIMPWMLTRIGAASPSERAMLPEGLPDPELTFTMTCTELHTATYTIKASSRAEALKKWEQLDWSDATDRTLQDSSDMTLEEAA